jgi:hypothetical protein
MAEIVANQDDKGRVSGDVAVSLSDLINNDAEGVNNVLGMKLLGSDLYADSDMDMEVVGISGDNMVVIRVAADPSLVLDLENLSDENLPAVLIQKKYSPGDDRGDHPAYRRKSWREAVSEDDTLLGYWDWVAKQLADHAG